MSDTAIHVNDVSKMYKLYDRARDRLKDALSLSKNKVYKEHYALHNVSFDVQKGETVGIIGTNGSGKSTILKIITGVLHPTQGEVEINGRISALLELGAGFNMEYTGIENVYLNGTMIGFTKEEIDAKLDSILEFADIGDFVYQPVKTYSSGMFVRLAFAVAINIDPEILIVDEALSVGDVFFQAKCYKKFEEFKAMGKTILFVSHDLSSIDQYCDRAILLNDGHLVTQGKPNDVIDIYKKILVGQFGVEKDDQAEAQNTVSEKWMSHFQLNPNIQEYGDKEVEIVDFALMDESGTLSSTLIKHDTFTLKVKVRANIAAGNPIVAFTIRTLKGTDVTGTNTMFEKIDTGTFVPGQEKTICFTQKLPLQGGEYLLCLGCTRFENNEFLVYHRLYDICNLTIISNQNTVGFFDLNSTVHLED